MEGIKIGGRANDLFIEWLNTSKTTKPKDTILLRHYLVKWFEYREEWDGEFYEVYLESTTGTELTQIIDRTLTNLIYNINGTYV